jgi:phospholipase A2
MDCGMANNLPNHILARPERGVDVFISFDASSDIHTGAAVQRLHHFAADFDFELIEETKDVHKPQKNQALNAASGPEVESRYLDYYARVFRGTKHNGQTIYVIYCPLLPNGLNPDFNPSVSPASVSVTTLTDLL